MHPSWKRRSPIVSVPGEVIPHHEFYSYEAKYLEEDGAKLTIPAASDPSVIDRSRQTSPGGLSLTLLRQHDPCRSFPTRQLSTLLVNESITTPGLTLVSACVQSYERRLELGIRN